MYPTWVFNEMTEQEKNQDNHLENHLVQKLAKEGFSITTAESCTGGLIAGTIVNVPGASEVLREGYVTYSNEAKERLVGVSHGTLVKHGAVSEETAREMAEGAAHVAHAEVALSTTGIAGPDGGTDDKPVGLVYIGCCVCGNTKVLKCQFSGSRAENRMQTVHEALSLALDLLDRSKFVG